MEDAQKLLVFLKSKGIDVFLENEKLKTRSAPGAITAEFAQRIKQNKDELIALLKQEQSISREVVRNIARVESDQDATLSFGQNRIWFVEQLNRNSSEFNIPLFLDVTGAFQPDIAQQAISRIIERHEILRTVYQKTNERVVPKVQEHFSFQLNCLDIRALPPEQQQHSLQQLIEQDRNRVFDLTSDLMVRASYIHLASDGPEQKGILLFNMHHIASDGWSLGIMVSEFKSLYEALLKGEKASLPDVSIQYRDYAHWQQQFAETGTFSRQVDYWREQLVDIPILHGLPLDYPRPEVKQHAGGKVLGYLSADISQQLLSWSKGRQLTPFMLFHAVIALLLSRHSNRDDIVIGTPLANRKLPEVEPLIGFFVNTLVLRTRTDFNCLDDYLEHIKQVNFDAQANQDVPFEQIVELSGSDRSKNYMPLAEVQFSMNTADIKELTLPGISFTPAESEDVVSKFDLNIGADIRDDGIHFEWIYDKSIFSEQHIQQLNDHLLQMLTQLSREAPVTLTDINMFSAVEAEHLLYQCNDSQLPYQQEQLIHQVFEQQVESHGAKNALVFEQQTLSYQELNEAANQIAHYLIEQGVGRDSLVGVYTERSLEMYIAILGILKAGGAYLPLDPSYPEARLEHMIADAGIEHVLTQKQLMSDEVIEDLTVLPLDRDIRALLLSEYSTENPIVLSSEQTPSQMAYVIYTSGSTGKPKGVMVEHRGGVNMCHAQKKLFGLSADSRVLQFASLSFDASSWEWMMALLQGATLYICNENQRLNTQSLSQLLRSHQISHATLPPAVLQHLELRDDYSLQSLIVAGEACASHLVDSWAGRYPMYNAYGPTETTVCASVAPLIVGEVITIGSPIANTQLHVLDDAQQLLPVGTIGELYIGGQGLARGYLNNNGLTAERFLEVELQGKRQRLYRSGDLVRRLKNGDIEFIGRIDSQIKIRGFRVELPEIEYSLNQNHSVEVSLVHLDEDDSGNKQLVAYIIPKSEPEDEQAYVNHLRAEIQLTLPAHMVPSATVVLREFPLTTNGKIDKTALPAPVFRSTAGYVAPISVTEKTLTTIWAEVLKCEAKEISVTSNFFELGGHSLLGMMLVGNIREQLGVDIDISALFDAPTIRQLAALVDNGPSINTKEITSIPRDGRQIPTTFGQQRLWFTDRLSSNKQAYNIPVFLQVQGQLDLDAVEQAVTAIIQRHEPLRTVFAEHTQQPVQVIRDEFDFCLQRLDLSTLDTDARAQRINELIAEECAKPFDLTSDLMIRASYLQLAAQNEQAQGILLFNMHHIAADGWSLGLLVDEFMAFYQAIVRNSLVELEPLGDQYGDYAHWQAEYLRGAGMSAQLEYWSQQLEDAPVLHSLPLDFPRPASKQHRGTRVNSMLPAALSESLQALARDNQVTPFIIIHAGISLLLSQHSNQDDILIGTPSANRTQPGLEKLIGFFVNTLVLRTSTNFDTFQDYLAHVKRVNQEALANQDVPFEKMVELSKAERSTQYMPLAEIQFNMDTIPANELSVEGVEFSVLEHDDVVARFDLNISADIRDDGIYFSWVYDIELFTESRIQQLNDHLLFLLERIIASPEAALSDFSVLSDAEQRQQLNIFNNTYSEHQPAGQIQTLFEQAAQQYPQMPALVFEDTSMTYQELNDAANQVAHYLLEQGVQPDTLVGVYFERSIEMMIAILAVLKSGAAYLPLDPSYPQSRIEYSIENSDVELVLTQQSLILESAIDSLTVVPLDSSVRQLLFGDYSTDNPELDTSSAKDLAYVIYTSGSTGQPKGVMIEHQGAINMSLTQQQLFKVQPQSKVLHFASLGFDAGVSEWMMALLSGASLHICNEEQRLNPAQLSDLLVSHDITHATIPPALLQHVPFRDDYSLECLIVAGEACSSSLVDKWAKQYPMFNAYGPTEASVCATVAQLKVGQPMSIGTPINNTQCFVMDNKKRLLPIGVAGELYLAGVGLARGYVNQPELTAERFILHSFEKQSLPEQQSQRLYRTGDLVRYLPDGNIEFVGRTDGQVKIRGFRIELAEICQALSELSQVVFNHVMVWQVNDQDKQLVAYVQPVTELADYSEFVAQLRAGLKGRLPDYMIPSVFVVLDDIPLTENGKVDTGALPPPEEHLVIGEFVAPETETEKQLAIVWSQLLQLKVEDISADANFFELGGHSLLAVRLVSEIRDRFDVELPVNVTFDAATLRALAGEVATSGSEQVRMPIKAVERGNQLLALSFAQQRLWFIDHLKNGTPEYNSPVMMSVEGHLDLDAIELAISRIIARHESLRTRFVEQASGPVQEIMDSFEFKLKRLDLSSQDSGAQAQEARRLILEDSAMPFDLSRDLMIRATYLKLAERGEQQKGILMFNMHHIATDGWSMGVLVREFESQYKAALAGNGDPLPPLEIQYGDYAISQRQLLEGETLERQLGFWRRQLENVPAVHSLQLQRERNELGVKKGLEHTSTLSATLTQSLLNMTNERQMTPFMLLHAAIALVLSRNSNRHDLVIGTPVANRMQKELEPLIGFFVNTLALRTNTDFDTLQDYLAHVRQVNMDAQANQDIPFEYLVEHCQVVRSEQHTPLFQIMFKMTNYELAEIDLPEISVEAIEQEEIFAKFDIEITAQILDGKTSLSWIYDEGLFDPEYIASLDAHLHRLLQGMTENEQSQLHQLPMLGSDELHHLLNTLNDTQCPFPRERLLHETFQEHAATNPEQPALIFADKSLSYRELNEAANQLAHYLRSQGVGPETLVGLCFERSFDMVISLLATLKAGGAYVPLDPDYPEERLSYMLRNSEVRYVLSHSNVSGKLSLSERAKLIELDRQWELIGKQPKEGIQRLENQESNTLAYVIYTSGSTGEPKGVMLEHQAVVNRIDWMQKRYQLNADDKVLQKTPYSFDVSVWEFFWTLGQGATLVIAKPGGHKDPVYLGNLIAQTNISVLHFVPSMLSAYIRTEKADFGQSVRLLLCSGEALDKNLVTSTQAKASHVSLHNLYGPTEAAIDVSAFDCALIDEYSTVPIGKPIQNIALYVLDPQLNICPMGVVGELYIAGVGLARGYLNQPELTKERFIESPLGDGTRWYRTGDLVRYLPDGNIDYLGRIDEQVKIRGLRIELGEIQNQLLRNDKIEEAVLSVQDAIDGDKILAAYLKPTKALLNAYDSVVNYEKAQEWQGVWDDTYSDLPHASNALQNTLSEDDKETNFIGWDCSYRGHEIPLPEMHEWLDNTVSTIKALQPKSVLEIGVGTGLLLYRYAADCDRVCGLDISANVIANLRQGMAAKGWSHVTLEHGNSLDLSVFDGLKFDTIILNSVAQYFPGANYLAAVLEEMSRFLSDDGKILLGDLRNLDLKEAFATSVAVFNAQPDDTAEAVRHSATLNLYNEEELLISPSYFADLVQRDTAFTRFDVMVKQGLACNEMTRYRYDVVLYKGTKDASLQVSWHPWQGSEALRELLSNVDKYTIEGSHLVPAIHGFRNERIYNDVLAMKALQSGKETDLERIKSLISLECNSALFEIQHLAREMGYKLKATWSQHSPELLDLIFIDSDANADQLPAIHAYGKYSQSNQVSTPQLKNISRHLVAEVNRELEKRLPAYMLPNAYLLMESFPLSKNGKVDKKALPKLVGVSMNSYRAATNETEEKLQLIWKALLQQPKVGIDDNFFALGGHSLLGIRLINEIRRELNLEIGIATLFDHPTIAGLADYIENHCTNQQLQDTLPAISPVNKGVGAELPLSFAQQRLWFIDQLKQGSPEYNMPVLQTVMGQFDVQIAQRALSKIIERHQILRTVYREGKTGSVQSLLPHYDFEITYHDLRDVPPANQEARLEQLLSEDMYRTFELSRDLMVSATYVHLSGENSQQKGVLLFNLHHIAGDGWSLGILVKEFIHFYQELANGEPSENQLEHMTELVQLDIQYSDYAIWQRQWLTEEVLEKQLDYWREQLSDIPVVHSLPTDYPRPAIKQSAGGIVQGIINKTLSDKIQQLALDYQVTPFMLLHGALAQVLARHSGTSDIVLGTPLANRQTAQLEPLFGCFVNNLVLRVNTDFSDLRQYLAHVKSVNLDAQANQNLPFEQLVEHCQVPRNMQHTPLFQIMFSMDNYEVSNLELPGLTFSPYNRGEPVVKFDLDISAGITEEGIIFNWIYDTSLFKKSSVEALSRHIKMLLEQLVSRPERQLFKQPIMSENELQSVIASGMTTVAGFSDPSFSEPRLLHQLIEAQAKQQPEAIALVFEGRQMNYGTLNAAANRLAHHLRAKGVTSETPVGICLERSCDMLIAILAVLKAGGAYLPLDPSYPASRLEYMVTDTNIRFLITEPEFGNDLANVSQIQVVMPTETQQQQLLEELPTVNPEPLSENQLSLAAYVIYTSGSTGKPKGVLVEQGALLNFAQAIQDKLSTSINHQTRALALTTFGFDIAVLELLVPLAWGGQVVIASNQDAVDPTRIATLVAENNINLMQGTPATWQLLVNSHWQGNQDLTILCGGEELPVSLAKPLLKMGRQVWNCFGPTEATVWSLVKLITEDNIAQDKVPLGSSLANYHHFVLDANLEFVPEGVMGELCIAGQSLAREYLNRPELNTERFVEKSLAGQRLRLYRTGDLVRSRGNGDFEFCGRMDHQVKLRGYRIELGEIESLLAADERLNGALVTVRGTELEQKQIMAYVVPKPGKESDDLPASLRQKLGQSLPAYMLPSAIFVMKKMPLLNNGKVDRSALPSEFSYTPEHLYVPPQTENEKVIMELWSEILDMDAADIGVNANFFELGGHSLLLVRFITLAEERLNLSLPLEKLFNNPTVSDMADLVGYLVGHNELTREIEEHGSEIERVEF